MNAQRADDCTFDYQQELERRIAQFDSYLRKMYRRAHEEVCGPCFLIFEEQRPDADSGKIELAEAAKPELELVVAAFDTAGRSSIATNNETFEVTLPDEGWREDDSQNRFIPALRFFSTFRWTRRLTAKAFGNAFLTSQSK